MECRLLNPVTLSVNDAPLLANFDYTKSHSEAIGVSVLWFFEPRAVWSDVTVLVTHCNTGISIGECTNVVEPWGYYDPTRGITESTLPVPLDANTILV